MKLKKKYMRSCDQDFSEFLLTIRKGVIKLFNIPKNWDCNNTCTTTHQVLFLFMFLISFSY